MGISNSSNSKGSYAVRRPPRTTFPGGRPAVISGSSRGIGTSRRAPPAPPTLRSAGPAKRAAATIPRRVRAPTKKVIGKRRGPGDNDIDQTGHDDETLYISENPDPQGDDNVINTAEPAEGSTDEDHAADQQEDTTPIDAEVIVQPDGKEEVVVEEIDQDGDGFVDYYENKDGTMVDKNGFPLDFLPLPDQLKALSESFLNLKWADKAVRMRYNILDMIGPLRTLYNGIIYTMMKLPILFVILPIVLSNFFNAYVWTQSEMYDWYGEVDLPGYMTLEPATYYLVWSTLYIFMGVAAYLVATSARLLGFGSIRDALALWLLQLTVHFAWVPVLVVEVPAVSLAYTVLLLWLVLVTAVAFNRINRTAGLLMTLYFIWMLFAVVVTSTITYRYLNGDMDVEVDAE